MLMQTATTNQPIVISLLGVWDLYRSTKRLFLILYQDSYLLMLSAW